MRTSFALLTWAVIAATSHLSAYGADKSWEEYQVKRIDAITDLPSSEEILTLAALSANESTDHHVNLVKQKAWQRLTAIPNFPDLLIRRIQEERERWISGKQAWTVYDGERMRTLQHMGGLKHPKIVQAMGDLLSDLEVPGEDGTFQIREVPPNGVLAARALGQLVENPPLQKNWESYQIDDVNTWQLWYAQVKAGTRTFRFKGNPQEYNLQGPVIKVALPKGETGSRGGDLPGEEKMHKTERGSLSVGLLAATLGILGLAGFFAFRRQQGKAA